MAMTNTSEMDEWQKDECYGQELNASKEIGSIKIEKKLAMREQGRSPKSRAVKTDQLTDRQTK